MITEAKITITEDRATGIQVGIVRAILGAETATVDEAGIRGGAATDRTATIIAAVGHLLTDHRTIITTEEMIDRRDIETRIVGEVAHHRRVTAPVLPPHVAPIIDLPSAHRPATSEAAAIAIGDATTASITTDVDVVTPQPTTASRRRRITNGEMRSKSPLPRPPPLPLSPVLGLSSKIVILI